jgi:hypothetical protein
VTERLQPVIAGERDLMVDRRASEKTARDYRTSLLRLSLLTAVFHDGCSDFSSSSARSFRWRMRGHTFSTVGET